VGQVGAAFNRMLFHVERALGRIHFRVGADVRRVDDGRIQSGGGVSNSGAHWPPHAPRNGFCLATSSASAK